MGKFQEKNKKIRITIVLVLFIDNGRRNVIWRQRKCVRCYIFCCEYFIFNKHYFFLTDANFHLWCFKTRVCLSVMTLELILVARQILGTCFDVLIPTITCWVKSLRYDKIQDGAFPVNPLEDSGCIWRILWLVRLLL